jgi:hypothetical protein
MTDIEQITEALKRRTDDELRDLIANVLPQIIAAAQAVLDARTRRPMRHGTGCSCCGAGVKQWR